MGWPKISLDGHSNANQGQLMDVHGDTLKMDCHSRRMEDRMGTHNSLKREERELENKGTPDGDYKCHFIILIYCHISRIFLSKTNNKEREPSERRNFNGLIKMT